ncbi:MAG: GIY-YIG nuclease family protein [Planctomycetes bacterium]|nr:GIY-YIG nuclease family protein [Planctomycetota bacterium]
MIECENTAFYTGYAVDIQQRYQKHCAGKGAKYTRAHKPLRLAACWHVLSHSGDAQRVEYLIKSLNRQEKLDLIADPEDLCDLAEELDIAVESVNPTEILK